MSGSEKVGSVASEGFVALVPKKKSTMNALLSSELPIAGYDQERTH